MRLELRSGGDFVLQRPPTVRLIALIGAAFAFGGTTMAQAPPVPPGGTVVAAGLQGLSGLFFDRLSPVHILPKHPSAWDHPAHAVPVRAWHGR